MDHRVEQELSIKPYELFGEKPVTKSDRFEKKRETK